MELTVLDRLALLNLLPNEGDITTLRLVRELKEELSFSEEEHAALAFKYDDEHRVSWKGEAEPNKEFDFRPKARAVIVAAIEKADKAKKLTLDHVSVYEKFMEEEEPEKPVRINGRKPVKA